MSEIHIAYGQIDYEGRDTVGVFDSHDAAVERCREIERLRAADDDNVYFYSRYYVERWTVGRIACDESMCVPRIPA
jgi:hypothetical protein